MDGIGLKLQEPSIFTSNKYFSFHQLTGNLLIRYISARQSLHFYLYHFVLTNRKFIILHPKIISILVDKTNS
jgi:hypothetical protein